MAGVIPVLLVLLGVAAFMFFSQLRQTSAVQEKLRAAEEVREEKRKDAEAARSEAREKREELEKLREEVQELRSKLKKKQQNDQPQASASPKKTSTPPALADSGSGISAVRISNQELEDEHERKLEALRAELEAERSKREALEKLQAERDQALSRAKKALEQKAAEPMPVTDGRRPEETIDALKTQIEAMERATEGRERAFKKDLDKYQVEARAAEKRASANHQLYQVAKGQLVGVEERLAALRRKYEGALAPEQLKKQAEEKAALAAAENAAQAPAKAEAPAAEPAPAAPEAAAPSA